MDLGSRENVTLLPDILSRDEPNLSKGGTWKLVLNTKVTEVESCWNI